MFIYMKKYSLLIFTCLFAIACSKQLPEIVEPIESDTPILPKNLPDYTHLNDFPAHFSGVPLSFFDNMPSDNQITNEGATLGRVLFYDKKLSVNNTIACASCHLQEKAFSDPHKLSTGFHGEQTHRQAMAIFNMQYHRSFFWDQRAATLEEQVLMPIQNEIEMGMTLPDLVQKLQNISYYPPLFEAAFGSSEISDKVVAKALAQFIRSITSFRSKYDEGMENNFVNFSALESDGKTLFMSGKFNCNHCHVTENFFENDARNNGLETEILDKGRGGITNQSADVGTFATPSLRNIEVTAPYMHDGRFQTLEQVIEHYNSGLKQNPNLDDRLTTTRRTGGPARQYNMTEYQKTALVAFLKTLTDKTLLTEERYSNPFIIK